MKGLSLEMNQSEIITICIDDLRIFGSPVHLIEDEDVSQMSEEGNEKENKLMTCKVPDRCEQDEEEECSDFQNCQSNKQYKCGCPPGETPTAFGCQKYDPCVYLPCLHGGTCNPSTGGNSNCSCLPSFKGNFCQFRSRKGAESDLAIPIVAIGISLCVLILALTGCLICQYINKARRRRELNPENSSESNLSEASSKAAHIP
ncbi:hypothetical protein Avbf_06984 [Armadillidium vulgare]|nr:hypothetical protein Avbf_06984 [Armadillidium vulgare]